MLVCGKTPDKVDQAKGPKAFAIGPLSLKLRWLVSKFFYSAEKNLVNRSNLKVKTSPAYFFPPILLSFVVVRLRRRNLILHIMFLLILIISRLFSKVKKC
jgi:hypothetical protein